MQVFFEIEAKEGLNGPVAEKSKRSYIVSIKRLLGAANDESEFFFCNIWMEGENGGDIIL